MRIEKVYGALEIIKRHINPEMVVLFGGEPTIRRSLGRIIHKCNDLDLKYILISNSTTAYPLKGLKNYTASVDCLIGVPDHGNIKKSMHGLKRLIEAKNLGVPDVVGNIIITKDNAEQVPEIVKYLSSKEIWSIVGLVHSGNEGFWKFRSNCPELVPTKDQVKLVSGELMNLLDNGALIHNVYDYFKLMPRYYYLRWHCKDLVYMTIDTNGELMTCPDLDGELRKYTIFDYPNKKAEIEKAWHRSIKKCPGCYYNHQFQLENGGMLCH